MVHATIHRLGSCCRNILYTHIRPLHAKQGGQSCTKILGSFLTSLITLDPSPSMPRSKNRHTLRPSLVFPCCFLRAVDLWSQAIPQRCVAHIQFLPEALDEHDKILQLITLLLRYKLPSFNDREGCQCWTDVSPPCITPLSVPLHRLFQSFPEGRLRLPTKTSQFRSIDSIAHVIERSISTFLYIKLNVFLGLERQLEDL